MSLITCPICHKYLNDSDKVCLTCDCPIDQIIAYRKNDQNIKFDDFVINNGLLKKYNGKNRTIIIPPAVKRIDFSAFYNSYVETVVVSNNVINISTRAFSNCKFLKKVYIGEKVEYIGNLAFSNCHNLKTVGFLGHGKIELGNSIFEGCDSLQDIICLDEFVKDCLIQSNRIEDITKIKLLQAKQFEENSTKIVVEQKGAFENKTANNIPLNNNSGGIVELKDEDYIDAYNQIQIFKMQSGKQGSIRELLHYVEHNRIFNGCRYKYITRAMSSNATPYGLYVELPKLNKNLYNTNANQIIEEIIDLIEKKYKNITSSTAAQNLNTPFFKKRNFPNDGDLEEKIHRRDSDMKIDFETLKTGELCRLKKYNIDETNIIISRETEDTPFS